MPEKIAERPDFADRLNDEIERILSDPAFERAPTQTRLLRFLAEQTISTSGNLSQFSIAVDGLGRPGDYDLTSDSYPRVQMSRLRRNLLAYYSRNAPGNEYCVYVRSGEYRLRLASAEKAYPELFKRGRAHVPPEGGGGGAAPGAGRKPRRFLSGWSSARVSTCVMLLFVLALIALGAVGELTRKKLVKPTVGLHLTVSPGFAEQTGWEGFGPDLEREAENYIAKSFVANFSESKAGADYVITMSFGMDLENDPDLRLFMKSADDRLIYSNTIRAVPQEKSAFIDEVSANLTYMLSPNGALAHDQTSDRPMAEASDYGCFIATEISRAEGSDMSGQVDKCLDRYPGSEYRAYWFARKALAKYMAGVESGIPIVRNDAAWDALQLALRTDRYNAFANHVAAKVEAARGNCERARIFGARVLERGSSYPALTSATLAEVAACGGQPTRNEDWIGQIHALAHSNPDPNPLLKMYLMLATLAIGEPGLTRDVASSLPIENAKGNVGMTNAAISRALSDSAFFRQEQAEIANCISIFIWNEKGRQLMLHELERAPSSA